MLIFLIPGTGFTEPQANRPYKICPEKFVSIKDAPCRIIGPTASIVHRMEIPNEDKKKIEELEKRIKILEIENAELKKQPPKIDIEKPTTTRGVRG